jgi:hypothetical protein
MDSNNQVKKQQRGWVQYQNLKLEVETYENYVQKIHFVTEVNNNYNPSPILNKAGNLNIKEKKNEN